MTRTTWSLADSQALIIEASQRADMAAILARLDSTPDAPIGAPRCAQGCPALEWLERWLTGPGAPDPIRVELRHRKGYLALTVPTHQRAWLLASVPLTVAVDTPAFRELLPTHTCADLARTMRRAIWEAKTRDSARLGVGHYGSRG